MHINIAHSPDADDYFLFWALRKSLIDKKGFTFSFAEKDTQELNAACVDKQFDICAISLATYPLVSNDYFILPFGSSVGRNFGPVIIAKKNIQLEMLNDLKVGIPGRNTTAALLFKNIAPGANTIEIPIRPYNAVFEALEEGSIDAAVVIHEGQIDYSSKNCKLLLDLGKWWFGKYKLPIPLGINVIKSSYPEKIVKDLSFLVRDSIEYALINKQQLLAELFEFSQKRTSKLGTIEQLDKYLSMYANEDSLELKADCDLAIQKLLGPETYVQYSV